MERKVCAALNQVHAALWQLTRSLWQQLPWAFSPGGLTEESSTREAGQVEMKSTSSLPPHFETGRLEQVTSASRASTPCRTPQDPAGWGGHSTCLGRLLRGLRRLVRGECLAQCQDCRESHVRAMLSINYDCSNSSYHVRLHFPYKTTFSLLELTSPLFTGKLCTLFITCFNLQVLSV